VGQQGSASGSLLLDLDGFEIVSAQLAGGEWQLAVQTTATVVGCVGCGVRADVHGRRTVRVRDLPIGGCPVVLAWRKRIWRCSEPACGMGTWTEVAAVCPRAVLAERPRAEAARGVGKDAYAVAAVARDLGVGWQTLMRAVRRPRPAAGRRPCPACKGLPRSGWTRPACSPRPSHAHAVCDRPGESGARSAAGPGGRPYQSRRWMAGSAPGPLTGWLTSPRSRWILAWVRQRAGRLAWPRQGGGGPFPRHPAGQPPWPTRSAAACSRPRSAIGAAPTTRCTGSASCCSSPPSSSPSKDGRG
jgi:zinc-finger of transposase IS204/IS1001/IS1096/IS1165